MFRKIVSSITVILILFVLAGVFDSLPQAFAQDTGPSGNLDSAGFGFALSGTGGDNTGVVHPEINPDNWIRWGINYIFTRIIQVLAGVIGGLSVLVMSYGGFLILSSAGGENQYQKGVNYIKNNLYQFGEICEDYTSYSLFLSGSWRYGNTCSQNIS